VAFKIRQNPFPVGAREAHDAPPDALVG